VAVSWEGGDFYACDGVADLGALAPAGEDSVYCIASVSKSFASAGLCLLSADGRLDLDRPIKEIFPDFRLSTSYLTEHLTVRDLLSHRSGIPRHDLAWVNHPGQSLEETVHGLRVLPTVTEPRYRFFYQNQMFALATFLIQTVSEKPWQNFLRERLLEPLGMNDTYASVGEAGKASASLACPYLLRGGDPVPTEPLLNENLGLAGCLYSSPRDLLRWVKFQMNGDENILPQRIHKQMHEPTMIIRDGELAGPDFSPEVTMRAYGLAWFTESYRGHRIVYHTGSIDGFRSAVGFIPEKDIALAAIANADESTAPVAALSSAFDLLLGLSPVDWHARIIAHAEAEKSEMDAAYHAIAAETEKHGTDADDPADYLGSYTEEAYGILEITTLGEMPAIRMAGQTIPIGCVGKDTYLILFGGAPPMPVLLRPFRFLREQGQVIALEMQMEEEMDRPAVFSKL
jgi:CubicO group peptidase (beta-lactamase class C family)